ncbi:MAG: glycosyltransferase [Candidatus Levybacteria bacterium]|nr:glycosyltransferase [Candidatus Levybacteria bacterium]
MKDVFLSVVIPSYDEMANLRKGVLDHVKSFLDKQKYPYEVIVVDDGSKDGSAEFIEDFCGENKTFTLIKNSHMGKAGAVTTGVLKARGKYILFTDMDQATPIDEVKKLLSFFNENFDIVIGSRNSHRRGAPWTRVLMARSMMLLRSVIVGIAGISDTQCGFKMFKREVARTLFSKLQSLHHGFTTVSGSSVSAGFDVELLFLAQKMGYSIKEVPVSWLYVESRRVNPVGDSIRGVVDLFTIKANDLSGKYQ